MPGTSTLSNRCGLAVVLSGHAEISAEVESRRQGLQVVAAETGLRVVQKSAGWPSTFALYFANDRPLTSIFVPLVPIATNC